MIAKLLLVVVEAVDKQEMENLISDLSRAACDVANSSSEEAHILIEEYGFDLKPHDPLPEGVTLVDMSDPVNLHNTIAEAVGEPEAKMKERAR